MSKPLSNLLLLPSSSFFFSSSNSCNNYTRTPPQVKEGGTRSKRERERRYTHSLKNTTLTALPKLALNRPTDSESLLHFLPDLSNYVLKVCSVAGFTKCHTLVHLYIVMHTRRSAEVKWRLAAKYAFDGRPRQENQNFYSKSGRKKNN